MSFPIWLIIGLISRCRDFPIFRYFTEFFLTINYWNHIVPALQLVEAHQMWKSLDLPTYTRLWLWVTELAGFTLDGAISRIRKWKKYNGSQTDKNAWWKISIGKNFPIQSCIEMVTFLLIKNGDTKNVIILVYSPNI